MDQTGEVNQITMMTNLEGTIMDEGDRNMDEFLTTSVLLIDGSKNQRTYWADQLKSCCLTTRSLKPPMANRGWISSGLGD